MGQLISKDQKSRAPEGPPKGDMFSKNRVDFLNTRHNDYEANKPMFPNKALNNVNSYSSFILRHSANNRIPEKPCFMSSISRPFPRPQPRPEPQKQLPAIDYPLPNTDSFKDFTTCLQEFRLGKQEYETYTSRITNNMLREEEEKIRRAQQEQEQAEYKRQWFREDESWLPKPTLSSTLDQSHRIKRLKDLDSKYFKPKPERPELTPEMLAKIEYASNPYPLDECLTEIDGVQISRKDMRTLTGLNWLNDEIINAYMHLLVVRSRQPEYPKAYAFNTFFYPKVRESGYNSVKRWTRKVDIFSYDLLLVPVHLGNHWCLALIDLGKKRISYYDSMGGSPHGCCDTLLDYLRYELKDKKKQELDDENWRPINVSNDDENLPKQTNCSDCGVFACTYAEYLTRGAKMNFGQKHMPYFRKKMIYELLTKTILE